MTSEAGFVIQPNELAGFALAGWKHPSGVIQLVDSDRYINEWPKEIAFMGNTYTLEEVIDGSTNPETGVQWQNAEYA